MQKKIIALAVAGLISGVASAQVTVYGIADVAYTNVKTTGNKTVTAIDSGGLSGSRLGFKGEEDLGGGMKALFVLEYALAVDGNAGVGAPEITKQTAGGAVAAQSSATQARQQLVGVTGGFGTVVAGRAQTTGYDFSNGGFNALAGSALDPHGEVTVGSLITTTARADNAVAYISPNFGGVTVAVNHARIGEATIASTSATENKTANLLSATYANGPIKAMVVTAKLSDGGTAGAEVKENAIGFSYDFGVVKAGLAYQTYKAGSADKDKSMVASVAAPVGAGTIAFAYAKSTRDLAAPQNVEEKGMSIAYLHALSKRTTAYAGYEKISDDNNTADNSKKTLAAGIRHSF